jgi:hypothetical protein
MAYTNLPTSIPLSPASSSRRARIWIMEPNGRLRVSRFHRLLPRRFWGLIWNEYDEVFQPTHPTLGVSRDRCTAATPALQCGYEDHSGIHRWVALEVPTMPAWTHV